MGVTVESLFSTTNSGAYTTTDTAVNLADAPANTAGYANWNQGQSNEELVKWTGKSGNQVTGMLRGLSLTALTDTEVIGNKQSHVDGESFAITNVHYIINDKASKTSNETITGVYTFQGAVPKSDTAASATQEIMRYDETVRTTDAQTVAGVKTFSDIPVLPATDPTTDNQAARKAYVDSRGANKTETEIYYAGEALSQGNLVFKEELNNTDGGSDANIGRDTASAGVRQAQSFIAGSTASSFSMTVSLKKVGLPADGVEILIQTDNSGEPSGTTVTNGTSDTRSAAGIGTGYSDEAFTWPSDPDLTAGTKYWIVIQRTGANSNTNYYQVEYASNNSFRAGDLKVFTTTWTTNTGVDDDLVYAISGVDGTIVKTDHNSANNQRSQLSTLGFMKEAAAIGEQKAVTISGMVDAGLSSLTTASYYYPSATAGEITTSRDNARIRLGYAINADKLLFSKDVLDDQGSFELWPTDTPKDGWLLCSGQAVSRTTYSHLFLTIGTTYGVGDGSTTFNVPDLRGRFPLGQDDMGGASANRVTSAQADTLGGSDGAEDHTLTANESGLPAHTHDVNFSTNVGSSVPSIDGGTANTTRTTTSTGGISASQAHNNMPPYLTVNYIIKT